MKMKKMGQFRHVTCQLYRCLIIYILVFHPVPINGTHISKENMNLTALQINENIAFVNKTINNDTLNKCTKTVALIVGWLPDEGEIDMEGIYSRIVQAYHYSWPSAEFWWEAVREYQNSRMTMISIREMQRDWEYLRGYADTCTAAFRIWIATKEVDESNKEAEEVLINCLGGEIISQVKSNEFGRRVMKMCQESLDVVLTALLLASDNTQIKQLYKPFEVALFARMYNETLLWDLEIHDRLTNSFPQYIEKLKKEGKDIQANETGKKFEEIKERMKVYPYNLLYFNGDEDAIEEFRRFGTGVGETGFESLAFDIYNLFYEENLKGSESRTKRPYYLIREDWIDDFHQFEKDWQDGIFDNYRMKAEKLFQTYLQVEPIKKEDRKKSERNEEGILIGDGLWDWDVEHNGIHNMRLAWDLMGAVLEEIKCYLKESYYFDLRETALQNTQLSYEQDNKLFSGISRTMFTGCRIVNDTDLVSPYCTRENHEICAPIGPLEYRQRPESTYHGGKSVLKPKWIFELKENKTTMRKECVGRKDYVIQMNYCRCGFRMDCGKDLGVNITCQLEPNDLLRGQCRGGVGYPCKTLPLAKGKFHQTCRSGYCNLKTNSCEDRPYRAARKGVGYVVRGNEKFILICLFKIAVMRVYFLH